MPSLGGGVLGFFSQEELILAGFDAEHPCDAEIIAEPAQCEQEQQTWSFPLRHQGHCRAPTAADKLKTKYGPSGSFTYSHAGKGRGRRDPPCSTPRVRNPAKRKLHPRRVLQQEGSTSTMEDYADDVPQTLQVIIIAKRSVHQRAGHGTRSHRGAFLARLGAAKRCTKMCTWKVFQASLRQKSAPRSAICEGAHSHAHVDFMPCDISVAPLLLLSFAMFFKIVFAAYGILFAPVSYTHLTLPTI